MPEGDTIHQLARVLRERLSGRELVAGRVRALPELSLDGRTVEGLRVHGKQLFIAVDELELRSPPGNARKLASLRAG